MNARYFRSLVATLLLLAPAAAGAADAIARVQHLSGTLSVLKRDGSSKILSQKSEIDVGDTLATEKDSYAHIGFTDGSTATLRPNSRMKIEDYRFAQEKPAEDGLFFRLLKGGLRTVTGLVGKRGNYDAYRIGTSTATIGIRGSSGDTLDCAAGCAGVTPTSGDLPPGTYHQTYTGAYTMDGLDIPEGKIGFKAPDQPPVLLPVDPGLNLREPPVSRNVGGGSVAQEQSKGCLVK